MLKLFLLVLCVCAASASDVLVLSEKNFESTIKENPFVLVEFYAPWCGHCKALAPEWEQAATQLKGKVPVAKVDCTLEQALCSEQDVQGYPTIKFFRNGSPMPYNGDRKANAIEAWVEKKTGDAFTTISSTEDYEKLTKGKEGVVVGFFSNKDSSAFNEFKEVTQATDDVTFAAVFDSSVTNDFQADTVKAFVDGKVYTSDGKTDLVSWVFDYAFPLVDKLNQKGFERFVKNNKSYFVLLFAPQVEPLEAVKTFEQVAVEFRKDLGFLWDLGEQYAQHASKLGISTENFPQVVAMSPKEKFHPMKTEFNAENLKKFFEDLLVNKIEIHAQSEDVPESNDGPVKIVVGKNFNEIVKESTDDVFLEIYAPWCGHCKTLAPIWEELGEKVQGKSGLVIAKVDGTANDIPLEVQGFPTLLFFKRGSKESPISYDGERDFDSLYKFVKENSYNLKDEL